MSISLVSLVITDISGGDVSRLTSANGGEEFNFTFTFSEKIFQASSGHTYHGTLSHFFDGLGAYATDSDGSTTLVWRGFLKTDLTEDIPAITIGLRSGWKTADETAVSFEAVPATNAAGEVVQGETGTPPEITTGAGDTASYVVGENSSSVASIGISDDSDTDPGRVAYSLSGADAGLFSADSETGHLSFKAAPNFEAPSDHDRDNTYDLRLTITDSIGQTDSQDITVTVTDRNDLPTGAAMISGTVAEDEVLTASNTLADEDGLGAISYQWQRDGVDLIGATGESYALTQADVGAAITVVASYTDDYGAEERVVSAATAPVANVNDLPTGAVTVSGTVAEDEVLTASNTLADEDGLGTISYQWQRDGVDLTGATEESYTLTQADVGAAITVVASYTDVYGAEEHVVSAATAPVANVNDLPTGAVTLAGTARVGHTLSASNTLSDADGMGAISYQWLRNGEVISGATEAVFTLSIADVGATIAVRASYRDGQGANERVLSVSTEPVASTAASSGDDLLKGTPGNDVLEGRDGSDILIGEAGNDILVGGALELFLPFPGLQVYLAYQAVLGRAPDSEGFSYWSGQLQGALAVQEFLGQLLASEEFLSAQDPLGDEAFVGQLYANLFGHSPSPETLILWMDRLGEGAPREEVAGAFIEQSDVLDAMKEEASAYLSAISNLAGEFEQIFRLYQATLNRLPDPEGIEFWAEQLANGLSFERAIEGFITSEEFQDTYGALDHPAFVAQLYQNVLGREADDAGQAFWTQLLEEGLDRASVVAGFATSEELIENAYPDFLAFMRGLQGDRSEGGAGDDILVGSLRADHFIFNAMDAGKDLVVRFDPWDTIDLRGFGYADAEDALTHFEEIGGDAFFSDGDVHVHFANTPLSVFEDATFIV